MTEKPLRLNPELEDMAMPRKRFMMVLSYDGAAFNGWQIQPSDPSVQESVERALQIILRVPLHIVGAGRTDTGVNAREMTAHFDLTPEKAAELESEAAKRNLVTKLNAILRPAIAIHRLFEVDSEAHARFDATARTYRYYIHSVPDPFRDRKSRYIHRPLDFELMNREALQLLGVQDFTSFSKLHTDTNNNICDITDARWHKYGEGHYYFEIKANRFLRNMVRAIVGTLLDVGSGKAAEGHVRRVIDARNRCSAGTSVPGYALYLWKIDYPYPIPNNPLPDIL